MQPVEVFDKPSVINAGQIYMTDTAMGVPEGCSEQLLGAAKLFREGKYEQALGVYLKIAHSNSDSPYFAKCKPHDLYNMHNLLVVAKSFLNNYSSIMRASPLEKAYMTLSISSCINNIIAKYFNANDYSCVMDSAQLQVQVLVCLRRAIEGFNAAHFMVDFKCNNSVNYSYALYELNCGIIRQALPGKQHEAVRFINNALLRTQELCRLEPNTKHLRMASIIQERLGDSKKAFELAERAISQTSQVGLENISSMKYVASMEANRRLMDITLY